MCTVYMNKILLIVYTDSFVASPVLLGFLVFLCFLFIL